MAVTYTWSVVQLDCYPQYDGETDVVFTVHWSLAGTDGTYTASAYGSQEVTVDPDATFTPYEKLTEDQVIGWVQGAMGKEEVVSLEFNIAGQIDSLAHPPVVTPPLPWGK